MMYLQVAGGLVLLLGGGDLLVRGGVAVARRLRVSPLVIGITFVGFGTSTPELMASLNAALSGVPAIAVGNIVGSNIANILLVLGVAALLWPMACTREAFLRDGSMLVVASILMVMICHTGTITRVAGFFFVALLGGYLVFTYRAEREAPDAGARMHEAEAESVAPLPGKLWVGFAVGLGGLAAVLIGAHLLIGGAVDVARASGVSESVIGLTLVAIGTSLPELATAVAAGMRRQTDVAFGNILGSNIFNIFGIAGVTALVHPLPIEQVIMNLDIWVMLGAALVLVLIAVTGWRISRWEGGALLAGYGVYIWAQFSPAARAVFAMG